MDEKRFVMKNYQYIHQYSIRFSLQTSRIKRLWISGLMMVLSVGLLLNSCWIVIGYQTMQVGYYDMHQLAKQLAIVTHLTQQLKLRVDQLHSGYDQFAQQSFVHYQQLNQLCQYWLCQNPNPNWQTISITYVGNAIQSSIVAQHAFSKSSNSVNVF